MNTDTPRRTRSRLARGILCALLLAPHPLYVAGAESPGEGTAVDDFTELSLEELMSIEVTSVSKRPERLHEAPAAIYVLTPEDIKRSGARTIPEALRMVPGLNVARIDANTWAISSRGFNSRFANKLLVLRDGRSVYTPFYSGVYWDSEDIILEDLERIEVIRGPGGTLWGANAVGGVINIITKSAKDTQGGLLSAGGGTEERGFASARYGGQLGESTYYRVFGKTFYRDGFVDRADHNTDDDWDGFRLGGRVDSEITSRDLLTALGEIYYDRRGNEVLAPTLTPPFSETSTSDAQSIGGNLLARWTRSFSDSSELVFQTYYDHRDRDEPHYEVKLDAVDIELQHRFAPLWRQEVTWGVNYRFTTDELSTTQPIGDTGKTHDSVNLISAFLQDSITLVDERVRLTLGSKFGHNDYTEFEIQPSARLLLTPHERHTVWAAVSRAVRTPSRAERDIRLDITTLPPNPPAAPLPTQVSIFGDHGFDSEDLLALELGYRVRPVDSVSLHVAGFLNFYENLRSVEPGTPFLEADPAPPHGVQPLVLDNRMDAETFGVEADMNWQATDFWRIMGGFTFLRIDLQPDSSSGDTLSESDERESPRHQAHVRSYINLPWNLQFDTALYYVDSLAALNVPSYVRLDLRLGWQPREDLELSVVAHNLLDSRHPEFGMESFVFEQATENQRGVYAMLTWKF